MKKLIEPAFGAYAFTAWRNWLMRLAQSMPVSWLGRRGALIFRRLALFGWCQPVDGEVEGLRMRVHIADNVSERKFLFMPQFVDPVERGYIRKRLKEEGGFFLDIGANAGVYSLTAASALAESGKPGGVIAVEPNPTMLERLSANIELNEFSNLVRIYPLALSDHAGQVQFNISDTNLGESGLAGNKGRKITVPCDTLLNLLKQANVAGLSGMKIDVEGMEDSILIPFLRHSQRNLYPGFIIIENSEHIWKEDLVGELKRCGYRLINHGRMNDTYLLGEVEGNNPGSGLVQDR